MSNYGDWQMRRHHRMPPRRRRFFPILTIAGIIVVLGSLPQSCGWAQQPYSPPDAELWRQMKEAFATISMPLAAHQQIQQIMQNVEQQARMIAAKAEAERKAKEVQPAAPEQKQ